MARKMLWPVLVIGALLIIMPFAISLPSKANSGQHMLDNFRPIMQPANVQVTADYYDNVFTKLRPVALAMNAQTVAKFTGYGKGMAAVQTESTNLVPALAQGMHTTPAQVQQFLGKQFPATAQLFASLPQMGSDFGSLIGLMQQDEGVFKRVPPGLDHYLPLVRTMQANVDNYKQIDSLPNFRLFTWFFVIPGILLVLVSGFGLWSERQHAHLPKAHPAV
jgi:hypothetical protein